MHPTALLGSSKNMLTDSYWWTDWHRAIPHRKQPFRRRYDLVLILYAFASGATTSLLAHIWTLQSLDRTCIVDCWSDPSVICALCSDWIWLMPLRWWTSYQWFCLSSCALYNHFDLPGSRRIQHWTDQAFSPRDCLFTHSAILYEPVIFFYLL